MILYTMMPQELVFQTEAKEFGKQKVITYDGIPLLVEMREGQEYHIIRNISSDPQHYLDSRYLPGAKIRLS